MASPQWEEGYTKVANEILEHTAKASLNGTQLRILLIVWRYTYGFGRKSHELSISFLANAIAAHEKQVQRELSKLIRQGVLIVTDTLKNKNKILAFGKNYEAWVVDETEAKLLISCHPYNEAIQLISGEQNNGLVANLTSNPLPKKERKKILKKEEITIEKIQFLNAVFLTQAEHDNLLKMYGKEELDDWIFTLNVWLVNNPKNQKKVSDHNLTIQNWKRREDKKNKLIANRPSFKQKEKQDQMDILNQFHKEGLKNEADGNGEAAGSHQNSVPELRNIE